MYTLNSVAKYTSTFKYSFLTIVTEIVGSFHTATLTMAAN